MSYCLFILTTVKKNVLLYFYSYVIGKTKLTAFENYAASVYFLLGKWLYNITNKLFLRHFLLTLCLLFTNLSKSTDPTITVS